jgi:hypothetical protein
MLPIRCDRDVSSGLIYQVERKRKRILGIPVPDNCDCAATGSVKPPTAIRIVSPAFA